MRGKRVLPMHIPGTIRSWKAKKRSELFALQQAAETFRSGCAFTPSRNVDELFAWIKAAREACSAAKWGR